MNTMTTRKSDRAEVTFSGVIITAAIVVLGIFGAFVAYDKFVSFNPESCVYTVGSKVIYHGEGCRAESEPERAPSVGEQDYKTQQEEKAAGAGGEEKEPSLYERSTDL